MREATQTAILQARAKPSLRRMGMETGLQRLYQEGTDEMTYRPTEFQINNSGAIGIDIRIDPESLVEQTMFFQIDQDSEGITVSLECLENILACANELLNGYRETRVDAAIAGAPK
jgi:hypothetical protein